MVNAAAQSDVVCSTNSFFEANKAKSFRANDMGLDGMGEGQRGRGGRKCVRYTYGGIRPRVNHDLERPNRSFFRAKAKALPHETWLHGSKKPPGISVSKVYDAGVIHMVV